MSVTEFLILAFTCSISVQLIRADIDGPILHPGCNEYEDASQPSQLAYPNDCNKFYKCSGGYAFPLRCPHGLHWSVKLNRCEFPAIAGCNENSRTTTTTRSPLNDNKEIVVLECPVGEDPSVPSHLPYPGDCSKFFKCIVGKAYPLNCPIGLHWSMVLNRCEWPSIAKCARVDTTQSTKLTASTLSLAPSASPTPASTPTPARTLPSISTPAATATASTTPASTAPPPMLTTSQLNSLCKNMSSAYLPYPGTCKLYIHCSYGMGRTLSCPENQFFNSKIDGCGRTCG